MSNVIEFQRPKLTRAARPAGFVKSSAPPKLTRAHKRHEWMAALAAIWANPKNWRRSKQGNAYIVIDDIDVCVVIHRKEDGFRWEMRWRNGDEPILSRWIFIVEQGAIDDAWNAVATVG